MPAAHLTVTCVDSCDQDHAPPHSANRADRSHAQLTSADNGTVELGGRPSVPGGTALTPLSAARSA